MAARSAGTPRSPKPVKTSVTFRLSTVQIRTLPGPREFATSSILQHSLPQERGKWTPTEAGAEDDILTEVLGEGKVAGLDPFVRVQLREVVKICRRSRSMSEAGRTLFAVSRRERRTTNDADRLRKYLGRFGIQWEAIGMRKQKAASNRTVSLPEKPVGVPRRIQSG
jgi:sigma54-dependent transcription regulator